MVLDESKKHALTRRLGGMPTHDELLGMPAQTFDTVGFYRLAFWSSIIQVHV